MTLLRRFAVRLSGFVVRRASAGSREWAEGLAREVEFVEGDWRALGWSLGGLRVLFRDPPNPLRNAAEIAQAGRRYAGSREHVPPMVFLIMVLEAFQNGLRVVLPSRHMSSLQRADFALAAVSAAYVAAVGWMTWRMRERPEGMDDGAWIEFYRGEIKRLRDLYSGFGALFSVAIVLFAAGSLLGLEGMVAPYLTSSVIACWLFLVWLVPRPARRFQEKLEQVDSILEQSGRDA